MNFSSLISVGCTLLCPVWHKLQPHWSKCIQVKTTFHTLYKTLLCYCLVLLLWMLFFHNFMCLFHCSAIEGSVLASTVLIFNAEVDAPDISIVTSTLVDAVTASSPLLAALSIDVSSIQIEGKNMTKTTTFCQLRCIYCPTECVTKSQVVQKLF